MLDLPKSKNIWASIIISLLHLTMIGNKKNGVGFENRLGPFSLHDALRFNLAVLIETRHVHFLNPLIVY
jgi:hypothetical protein